MKARIKKSGAIGDAIGTYMENDTKIVTFATGLTLPINEVDYIDEDWSSFRREAAKDILCSIINSTRGDFDAALFIKNSVDIADALIKQLKQE